MHLAATRKQLLNSLSRRSTQITSLSRPRKIFIVDSRLTIPLIENETRDMLLL